MWFLLTDFHALSNLVTNESYSVYLLVLHLLYRLAISRFLTDLLRLEYDLTFDAFDKIHFLGVLRGVHSDFSGDLDSHFFFELTQVHTALLNVH